MSKHPGLQCERVAEMKDSPVLPPLTCRIGKSAARLLSLHTDEEWPLSKTTPTNQRTAGRRRTNTCTNVVGDAEQRGSKEHSVSVGLTEAGRLLASQSGTHRIAHRRCLRSGTRA